MANWKVQLLGDDNTLTQLAVANKAPELYIARDGVDCFLESTEFVMMSDHLEVKGKAGAIIEALVASGKVPAGTNLGIGVIYKMHYDNSKTVYRD